MFIKNTSCWQITPNHKSVCGKLSETTLVSKQLRPALCLSVTYVCAAGSCSSARELPGHAGSEGRRALLGTLPQPGCGTGRAPLLRESCCWLRTPVSACVGTS